MSEYSWPWENQENRENGSYRAADRAAAWSRTVRALSVGTRITGEVVGRQPFGAFLAIDRHPDALGLARVDRKPRCLELPVVGQRVTGEVSFHAEYNHQVGVVLTEWAEHEDLLPRFAERVGQVVAGRVTKIAPIGVFVRIADCVEGLVPRTELPGPVTDPTETLRTETFREGQEVSVRITTVDLERSRILLSAEPAS